MSNYYKNSVDFPIGVDTIKYKDNAIAPNGVKEASRFENTINKSSTFTPAINTTLIDGKLYCKSIYLKSAGANAIIIPLGFTSTLGSSYVRWVTFNINTKTISYSHPLDPGCFANYKEYDNGWIRFWVTFEKTSTRIFNSSYYIGGYAFSSSKQSFWAWGAQLEEVSNLYSEPDDYEPVGVKSTTTFYNRDSNIKLDIVDQINQSDSLSSYYTPVYGSRVTFESRINSYETSDGYYNNIPLSINNLKAKFDLRFDLDELESQKLIDFIEIKQGVRAFEISDPTEFYKPLIGFCNEYAINHINKNHYEVGIAFEVDQAPTLLNWKNGSFINYEIGEWIENTDYEKYDIIFHDEANKDPLTEVIGVNKDGINKLNKFYYASANFNSFLGTNTEPSDILSPWRQDFFFEPDIGLQNDVTMAIEKNEFKNSFIQRVKTKKNIGAIKLNYKFTNITTQKAKAILHFLENKGGYRRFRLDMKSIYNKPKVFYSPSWSHTWKSINSHDIEVTLIEDPLGIISKKN